MLLERVPSASHRSFNNYRQKKILGPVHESLCISPKIDLGCVYESPCISPKIDLGFVYESPCISPILTIYFYDMYKTARQHSEDATCKFISLIGWLVQVWTSDNQRYCTTVICRTAPHQDPSSLPFPWLWLATVFKNLYKIDSVTPPHHHFSIHSHLFLSPWRRKQLVSPKHCKKLWNTPEYRSLDSPCMSYSLLLASN